MAEGIERVKCLIIGSGPAGYTAAVYAARANLAPILYTGKEPGGQLMITTDVENYPGYPDGIMGPQMMEDFRKQAERFGTDVRYELISKVDFSGPVHKAWSETGHEIHADSIIISTGASAKWLGLESEKRLTNKGVSACAVCDGFGVRHVRRFFLPGQGGRGRRGGRYGCGGSFVFVQTMPLCPLARPPRRAARFQDHAGAGF